MMDGDSPQNVGTILGNDLSLSIYIYIYIYSCNNWGLCICIYICVCIHMRISELMYFFRHMLVKFSPFVTSTVSVLLGVQAQVGAILRSDAPT